MNAKRLILIALIALAAVATPLGVKHASADPMPACGNC